MKVRYHWRVRTYAGRLAQWPGLRRFAQRRTESWGIVDTMQDGLNKIVEHLHAVQAVDDNVYVKTSCLGYLHNYGGRE